MSLPRWLRLSQTGVTSALEASIFPSTRPARALALRRFLLRGEDGKGSAGGVAWLRQFAAVAIGGVPSARPSGMERLEVIQEEDELRPGVLLLAGMAKKQQSKRDHCEARLVESMRRRGATRLSPSSHLIFYSVHCPCPSCAKQIAQASPAWDHFTVPLPSVIQESFVHLNQLSHNYHC